MSKNKKLSKKMLIIMLLGVVILVGVSSYLLLKPDAQSKQISITPANTVTNHVNLKPATGEDALRAEDNKQKIAAQQATNNTQPNNPASGTKTVKPVVTYAGVYGDSVEVGAYVNGVFEDGGSCTATFNQGTSHITATVKAVKNVSSVDCPEMSKKVSEFNMPGTWAVTVSYNSDTAMGKSDDSQIEIK